MKIKTNVYLSEKTLENADYLVKAKGYKSRNEVIEKAVNFFIDYTNNKEPGDFLSREIEAIISGNIELSERRFSNAFLEILSKLAVELGIQQQIFKAMISNITQDDIETFRKVSVNEIKNNQSILKYSDIVKSKII